ncbi:ANK REP REGION domain-containing protein [Citrus sinensis]|uniref:ANK REP REGION domain-containing protein n=1 Tax=Citrus sinensis TaxID=2711 RepID=A0ACB8JEU1_CITSI|nr:ANK REP REGION domain-containing protein [Citrus sinensis]
MADSQQASSINAQRESTVARVLFRALRRGDAATVRESARLNGNGILDMSQNRDTALHIAARFGHKNVVMEILELRPDLVSVENHKSETPMHVAARAGNFGVAKIFMRPHGNGNNTGTFDDILRKQDEEGNTPLHNAVRKCDGKMAFTMIRKDPELICYINKAGQSPLSLAIDAGLTHIACCIIKEKLSVLDHRGPNDLTLLHIAIIKSNFVVMAKILEAKRDLINVLDKRDRNPLHYAAALGHFEIACRLSDEDDTLAYERDCNGQSPLHLASENGKLSLLKRLLHSYPDSIEFLDKKNRNILHLAAQNGHANVVVFISKLPEIEDMINSSDLEGNTPLHLAAINNHFNIVLILARNMRVNIRATNEKKQTALAIVQLSNDPLEMSKFFATKALELAYERPSLHQNDILEGHGGSASGTGTTTTDLIAGPKNEDMAQNLLVMATLVATLTFTSAFTIPGGLVSMLLAFMTGLWIVLSYNLSLAITVCAIGLCLPIIIFIAIACFDSVYKHLYSSTQLLMTELDTIEMVDIYKNLKVSGSATGLILESSGRLMMLLFRRVMALFLDPDERSYRLSSAIFWLTELPQRYKYSPFSLFIPELVTPLSSPVWQHIQHLFMPVVSRISRRNVSPNHSEQDSLL